MGNTTTEECDVRDFAAQFPTPKVREAVRLCEAGELPWTAVAELFRQSLANAIQAAR